MRRVLAAMGVIALLLGLLLAACSDPTPVHYRNANAAYGQAEFNRDEYQCTRENTRQQVWGYGTMVGSDNVTDDNMVRACMRARGWYAVAAEPISPPSQPLKQQPENASTAYNRGDYATALRVWRSQAEQGNAIAQYNLGLMYDNGQGVPQDYVQAIAWYRKAAEQGNADAQTNLGAKYDKGQGVPTDYKEAAAWFRKAAEQGNAGGQTNLGVMYTDGRGAARDYAQAHKWFSLAVSRFPASQKERRDKVAQYLDQLTAKMTPAQIAEAQKLAREWKPSK